MKILKLLNTTNIKTSGRHGSPLVPLPLPPLVYCMTVPPPLFHCPPLLVSVAPLTTPLPLAPRIPTPRIPAPRLPLMVGDILVNTAGLAPPRRFKRAFTPRRCLIGFRGCC